MRRIAVAAVLSAAVATAVAVPAAQALGRSDADQPTGAEATTGAPTATDPQTVLTLSSGTKIPMITPSQAQREAEARARGLSTTIDPAQAKALNAENLAHVKQELERREAEARRLGSPSPFAPFQSENASEGVRANGHGRG